MTRSELYFTQKIIEIEKTKDGLREGESEGLKRFLVDTMPIRGKSFLDTFVAGISERC